MYYVLSIKKGGKGSWKLTSEHRTLKSAHEYEKQYKHHYPYRKTWVMKEVGNKKKK